MQTLIQAPELLARLARGQAAGPLVLLDCSFDLADPDAGERLYTQGHLPGAHYAHLERDLSGAKAAPGEPSRGRHPLPERARLAALAGRCGIRPGVQVVTYDAQGSPFAARAWWLLHWLGHAEVAVLDGGTGAWLAAGGALSTDAGAGPTTAPYPRSLPAMPTIEADALQQALARRQPPTLLDARAPERYSGQTEPLDPVAGHIPGAVNRFFKLNLQPDGRFKAAAELHADFAALLPPGADAASVVQQCGSGVTACHNLLAMAHAGLGVSRLYPGSWSEWCSQPGRPLARP